MSSKLYVGNLAWTLTEQDLSSHFAKHGTVKSSKIVMDRDTGKSKGFGFVEMASSQEAQTAIESSNGAELNGRALRVSEAQDKPRESRGGSFGGGRGGDRGNSARY